MKVLVTGGSGMLGSSFANFNENTILINSKDFDLTKEEEVVQMFKINNPDVVVHCAAKCGGVVANIENMSDFYDQNILMNTLVLKHSVKFNVKKVISVLSSCAYPKNCNFPLEENMFHLGEPFDSHYSYAYTKRMLDVQTRSIKEQYGKDYLCIIPNNLYGINDNYHLENSHVIPGLIRKFYEAKINNRDVVLWGDGSPMREFTFSEDIPKICKFLIEKTSFNGLINVGNTNEISIENLANIISEIFSFKGKIIWDQSRPNGQLKKPTSNKKLLDLGWKKENYTPLKSGLLKSRRWFSDNYPNIRGFIK